MLPKHFHFTLNQGTGQQANQQKEEMKKTLRLATFKLPVSEYRRLSPPQTMFFFIVYLCSLYSTKNVSIFYIEL